MSKGLIGLARAMWLGFIRDRTAVFFVLLFPLMFLVLFGGLFKDQGAPKVDVVQVGDVAVLDRIPPDARADLDEAVDLMQATDREQALEDVRDGDADAMIEADGSTIMLHFTAADPVRAGTVQGLVSALVGEANIAATGRAPAFTLRVAQVEDESLETIQYITPGLLGWAVAMGATFGAALTLVSWRQKQILRRLRLAPVRTADVVVARVLTALLVALAQIAIFIGIGALPYFGLQLSDFWWMSIPLVMCGTLAFLAIGLVIGAFTKTVEAASGAANLVVLPMAFLSGSFFPLDDTPGWLQGLSNVFPLRHLNQAMLDVMVRGEGPASVLPEMGLLLGIAFVLALLATRIFRWDRL